MQSKRICFPMPKFEIGGLERVQMEIAAGLKNDNFQSTVVTSKVAPSAFELIKENVTFVEFQSGKVRFVFKLLCWLKKEQPDFIITSSNDIGILLILLKKLIFPTSKVIWTQHLSISGPLKNSSGLKKIKLLFEKFLIGLFIYKSDAVIAVSDAVANELKSLSKKNLNVKVIYNPVASNETKLKASQPIQWPWKEDTTPTIIFVGRIAKVKRLDLLIRAFALLSSKMPVNLLVVGDGPEKKAATELANELGVGERCRFIGFQSNPLPWISKSNLLVLSSDYEGFGLVLVEAMACGTQVVSTDCPYGPAEILDNGRYGRLVPVNDCQALTQAMAESLKHPTDLALLKNRASDFSIESAIKNYANVLQFL